MGKRLLILLIGAITVVATIIGLAADFQDLIGGGDGAELVVEDFSATPRNSNRLIDAEVTVHNQGGEAAEDVLVKIVVTEDDPDYDVSPVEQSVESIVGDSSRIFNFTLDVSDIAATTILHVKAQVIYDDDTIESSTLQVER